MNGAESTSRNAPPSGRHFERATHTNKNRFANPFAAAVSLSSRRSSSQVICPIIETCASVAEAALVFVSVRSRPVSHA